MFISFSQSVRDLKLQSYMERYLMFTSRDRASKPHSNQNENNSTTLEHKQKG